jgi:leucine-rich repeat protein SHOC2
VRRLLLCLFHVCLFATQIPAQVSEHNLIYSIPSPPPNYPQTKSGFYFTKDSSYLSVVEKDELPAARFCKKLKRIDFLDSKKLNIENTVSHLKEMPLLISVGFVSCNLRRFPQEITALINLRSLAVVADSFVSIPASIGQLKELEFLDLGDDLYGGNALASLPNEMGALKKLRYLFLFGNNLTVLPESFTALPIEELRLRYNSFSSIQSISVVGSLRELDLSDNPLTEFSALGALVNLEELKLGGSGIRFIPPSFKSLLRLKSLYLGRNPQLDTDISFSVLAELKTLAYLNLDYSGWQRLPASIASFPALASLSLMHNKQLDLAQTCRLLKPIKSLRSLDLTACGMQSLPAEIGQLTQLTHLRLAMNELQGVDEICSLKNLVHLELFGNPMNTADNCLRDLKQLQKISFPYRMHPKQREKIKRLLPNVEISYI